jgi:glycosyltransferase involved in cell wall biosynthesis
MKYILYFGRISQSTKADLYPLLLVFKSLKERLNFKVKLILAGTVNPAELPVHKDMIIELGLDYDVQLMINFDEAKKKDLISSAELCVFPTDNRQKTNGTVIIEALDSGVPVVASDISYYRNLIEDGKTGFKIKTTAIDDLTVVDCEEMEEKIYLILTDENLRARMSKNAKERATARIAPTGDFSTQIFNENLILKLTPDGENLIKGKYDLPPAHDFCAPMLNLDFLAKLLIYLSQNGSASAKEFLEDKFTILWAAKYRLLRLK